MTALVISISCCFNQNRVLCVYFDEIKVNLTSDWLLGLSFFQEFKIQALLIKVQFPQTVMLLMMQMAVRQWSSFFFLYIFFHKFNLNNNYYGWIWHQWVLYLRPHLPALLPILMAEVTSLNLLSGTTLTYSSSSF